MGTGLHQQATERAESARREPDGLYMKIDEQS